MVKSIAQSETLTVVESVLTSASMTLNERLTLEHILQIKCERRQSINKERCLNSIEGVSNTSLMVNS